MPDQSTFIGNYYTAYVPNDTELITLGYTVVRFYSGATEAGSYSLLGTATLAAGTIDYSYNHTAGLATDWWYWAPYGATPGEGPASEPMPAGPPRITRKTIRQAVGKRLQMVDVYTLASATSSTIGVISELIDADATPHRIANRWARCSAGTAIDQTRRVRAGSTGYAVATGTLTVNRAFSPAWIAGDTIELWEPRGDRDPSVAIDLAMNQARHGIWWEDTFYFSTDSAVTEYVMPAIMREQFISRVEWATGTYPDEPSWSPVPHMVPSTIGGQLYLSVGTRPDRPWPFSAGTVIRVIYNRFGDRMDSDTDYWEVPEEWAVLETAAAYLRTVASPRGGREDVGDMRAALQSVEGELQQMRRIYMPQPTARVLAPR